MITGKTRLLAIVGDPIDKARSPESFCRLFELNGHDAIMIPVHVKSADLALVMVGLKAIANLDGIVATMPHKGATAGFADEVLETGRLVGAVNALRRSSDGRWEADMFDGRGFVAGLRAHGHDPAGATRRPDRRGRCRQRDRSRALPGRHRGAVGPRARRDEGGAPRGAVAGDVPESRLCAPVRQISPPRTS